MKRIFSLLLSSLFFLLLVFSITSFSVFAAESAHGAEGANWTDLLLKSINFFIFFGLLWFFFKKKIVAALKAIAQGEYKSFFSTLDEKKKISQELTELKQKLQQTEEKLEIRQKKYYKEVEQEKDNMFLDTKKLIKKLEENNEIVMLQEYRDAKNILYKKILDLSLKKFETQLKDKTIGVNEDKYFSSFLGSLKQKNWL